MRPRSHLSLGVLFVGGALLCGLVGLCVSLRAATRVDRLAPVTLSELIDSQPGQQVLIQGLVSDRNPLLLESPDFVAYHREVRTTEDSKGTAEPGNWSVRERLTPPLFLELPGGLVQIENDDYDIEDGRTVEVDPGPMRYSSTRYVGLGIGDAVIATGVVVQSRDYPQIKADFVARGTPEDYVARRRSTGVLFCVGSVVVAALGGIILFWEPLSGLLSRRH